MKHTIVEIAAPFTPYPIKSYPKKDEGINKIFSPKLSKSVSMFIIVDNLRWPVETN